MYVYIYIILLQIYIYILYYIYIDILYTYKHIVYCCIQGRICSSVYKSPVQVHRSACRACKQTFGFDMNWWCPTAPRCLTKVDLGTPKSAAIFACLSEKHWETVYSINSIRQEVALPNHNRFLLHHATDLRTIIFLHSIIVHPDLQILRVPPKRPTKPPMLPSSQLLAC
jgi:hypothetical protein